MHTAKLLAFLLFMVAPFTARAATCPAGQYLDTDGATCLNCSIDYGFYCPGDDTRHPCPIDETDWAAISGGTVTTHKYHAWGFWLGPGQYDVSRIEACNASVSIEAPQGRQYIEAFYRDGSYSQVYNIWWYPGSLAPGYYGCGGKNGDGTLRRQICECTGLPEHATFTGRGDPDVDNCPWQCNCGYERVGDSCVMAGRCVGMNTINTSTGVSVNLYARGTTSPALYVNNGNVTCAACLAENAGDNAINIQYDGKTYHTVNGY